MSGTAFALTLRVPVEVRTEERGGGYDVKGFKKGFTVVVRGARRSGVKEGKAGFVEVGTEGVKVCWFGESGWNGWLIGIGYSC